MLMLRFAHFLGVALWIGGALSVVALVGAINRHPIPYRVSTWPLLARVHALIIAPGAIITVVSGLLLTIRITNSVFGPMSAGVVAMQGTGIIAAVLALFVGLPTANQLALFARMDEMPHLPPEANRLQKRQTLASLVSGVLALAALFFGVVVR